MTKKIIGLVAVKSDTGLEVSNPYYEFWVDTVSLWLGVDVDLRVVDPVNKHIQPLDLLVLQGGADVNPLRYNAKPGNYNSKPNPHAEWFDTKVLPSYIEAGIPVFGVCRGFQTLNVWGGGSLDQHIVQERSTKSRGEEVDPLNFTRYNHAEFLTRISSVTKNGDGSVSNPKNAKDRYMVNSLHHQGIYLSNLSNQFFPLAFNDTHKTPDYRNIEAIIHKELPIIGVQWHPEELTNPQYSMNLIKYLLAL